MVKWYCPDIFLGAPVYTPEELGATVDDNGDIVTIDAEPVQPQRQITAEQPKAQPKKVVKAAFQQIQGCITENQVKRFWAIAKAAWSKEMIQALLADYGAFDAEGAASTKAIPTAKYEAIIEELETPDRVAHYAEKVSSKTEPVDAPIEVVASQSEDDDF